MKKGLLSILAASLLVVGCQDYDDQFSNLESQISAIATTVAGLSQVQTKITELSGTVATLSGTVNGLGDAIDTAVSDGLADIQSDIDAIETAVADVASSEEVSTLSDAVDASQESLDELLANSSIFQGPIVINSQATADLYASMGSGINIVNGDVTITVSEDMDQAVVQSVVNNILNIVGDLSYTANASTIGETTFNNLSGVESITAKQGGGYEFKALTSATTIVLNNDYKSTVDIIHFGALVTVTSISDDGGVAGTIAFDKANEFHLTSLVRYPGNNLNIEINKGGVLAMGALTDNQADGTAVGSGYALTVKGPASLSLSTISDGTITVEDVASLTVSGFIGNLDVNSGVETLVVTDIVDIDLAGADDLVTATIDGALDSDANLATADGAGPAITFASQDLTTATITGITGDINATGQANLETLTIGAELKNGTVAAPTSGTITVSGNNDLVTLTLTGAKAANVIVNANTDLETLTIDHTTTLAGTDTGGNVDVTGNTNLTELTISADTVDDLNISGNTQLATLAASGLTVASATSATVLVKSNNFTASKAADKFDTAPATSDTGAYTSSSGLSTLKAYLTDAMAATTTDIEVYFDVVELVQTQASATATYADAAHTDAYTSAEENAIAYSKTTAASGATVRETETVAWAPGLNALYGYKGLATGEGVTVTYGGVSKTWKGGTPATVVTVDDLIAAINADTTFGSGITLTAGRDAWATSYNVLSYTDSSGGAETTASTGTILYSFGTATGTITIGSGSSTAQLATALAAKVTGTVVSGVGYQATASGDAIVVTRLVTNTQSIDRGVNTSDFPDLAFDLGNTTFTTVDLSSNANTTNSTGVNSDFFIGFTQTNVNGLRVTVKNNSTGVALAATVSAVSPGTALVAANPTELVSGTNMPANAAYDAGFSDISDVTAASTTAKNRISWLG
ncbi:hypothetical protein N8949_00310 [Flavobacteriaceae bacterium]|nr:hypothetical protein [Flavobacteriaceae bacterium]